MTHVTPLVVQGVRVMSDVILSSCRETDPSVPPGEIPPLQSRLLGSGLTPCLGRSVSFFPSPRVRLAYRPVSVPPSCPDSPTPRMTLVPSSG